MGVNLCVPTLNRYDLLTDMLKSAMEGDLKPEMVWIINNGRNIAAMQRVLLDTRLFSVVITPYKAMGLAESWNWFIRNVPEERLIVNDDITFAPESIRRIIDTPGDFVTALLGTNAFSCFLHHDSCRHAVGLFDETISPGYAYWEDVDYAWRLEAKGIQLTGVECGVVHHGSQTIRRFTPDEIEKHNKRFMIAQENFLKKWGRLPADRERQMYGKETSV